MRFIKFLLSHSLFIACCAAALCYQTNLLLHLPHSWVLYGLVFFSTLCSYNFYWLLSKFYFSDRRLLHFFRNQFSFILLFVVSAFATLSLLIRLPQLLPFISIGLLLTLIYSLPLWPFPFSKKLQKAGIFKTTLLALTWAYVTVALPAAMQPHTETLPTAVLFCARFFFMLLLCVIFDMRDISMDQQHGLHSLATDMSKNKLRILIGIAFIFYIISGMMLRYYFRDDMQVVVFALTGIFVWTTYRLSFKPRGYYFYYFAVDGLMLLSALLSFLADRL